MPQILIKPVETVTKNGFDAQITGIGITDIQRCLFGNVKVKHGNPEKTWDLGGICVNDSDVYNLVLGNSEIADIIDLIKKLRPDFN